jgi:DMSO/TMAO reductase YedYZ molybdopterin-dependent catalytic subunit
MSETPRYSPSTDPFYQPAPPPGPDSAPHDAIISPDVRRTNRVPPGQTRTKKWPVLQAGRVPQVSTADWSLTIDGLVGRPLTLTWEDFQSLPRVRVLADFHCVTRWSRLGNLWEGVAAAEIARRVGVRPEARFVVAGGYDDDWTTNLPLAEFLAADALLADRHDGRPLTADHGGPVRLIVPRLYAWKSAKWLRGLTFLAEDAPGFWERLGYHDHGDPWTVDANHSDGERFRVEGPLVERSTPPPKGMPPSAQLCPIG